MSEVSHLAMAVTMRVRSRPIVEIMTVRVGPGLKVDDVFTIKGKAGQDKVVRVFDGKAELEWTHG